MAVRVEDYEAYYKKQKADSNCGFAEEFEVKHELNIKRLLVTDQSSVAGNVLKIMQFILDQFIIFWNDECMC